MSHASGCVNAATLLALIRSISINTYIIIIVISLKQSLKRPKYKVPFSMEYRERESHARGVRPTQYTSCMGTARVKQEEETDRNNARVARNLEERNVGTKGKSTKQDLNSTKDLTIEPPRDASPSTID